MTWACRFDEYMAETAGHEASPVTTRRSMIPIRKQSGKAKEVEEQAKAYRKASGG